MSGPIRDHAARQPGIATYAEMLAGGPTRPWTPHGSRPAPVRITPTAEQIAAERGAGTAPKPTDAPTQIAAEPPAEPVGGTGRPEPATAISADHPRSQAVSPMPDQADTATEQGKPAAPMFLPYAPEERVRVARIRMHPDLIATLPAWHGLRADPGPGLLGVPVIPDDTLPPGGWRSYDRDGNLLAGHPPAVPEPTGFITTARPRPAPRPPWWRRWADRIRQLTRKD